MKKVDIGEFSKVNIKWQVRPIDYSHEEEQNIINKFASKYCINKDNIKIIPNFVDKNNLGEITEYTNNITENIQDVKFQQKLFKRYIEEKNISDCDLEEIIKIDDTINSSINLEKYEHNKRYAIKWIKWDNFMSYGSNNYFDFTQLNGLVLLTSEPANQGGKTTFCLDLIRFLLFGKVTSRESDWTLSKVFNKHLPECTECVVEGCVCVDGVDYVIKRTVNRSALNKRTSKSKVSQKVEYYKLVNEEYVDLYDEECEEEVSGRETNKKIKDAIGNERDFDLMICVDSDNLKGLISLKDTERGRLISRWIGLLPLEEKDKVARETFNKNILPSLQLNRYNKEELKSDIVMIKETIDSLNKDNENLKTNISSSNSKIESLQKKRDTLLSSKRKIDDTLLNVDVHSIEQLLNDITNTGKIKRVELKQNKDRLETIKDASFNKEEYDEMVSYKDKINSQLAEKRAYVNNLIREIDSLKKSEFCPTCGARLSGVDNTKSIEERTNNLDLTRGNIKVKEVEYEKICNKIKEMDVDRDRYNERLKLEILVDKIEVDIDNLLRKYKENKRILDDIEKNKQIIEENNNIETSLKNIDYTISVENKILNDLNEKLTNNDASIKMYDKNISDNLKIISIIEDEEKIVKNWKLYLEMIGKNGISKLVLRTVLPLINGELKHLLSDVCDFEVKVVIDDHNDVAFYLIHDGVESNLSSGSGFEQTVSSLALRSVLSKISSFSKPSFVVFDEILGGVAEENYDSVKLLYDKIVSDYKVILQITHNKNISDWHKKTIVIKKENNISKIKLL